MAVCSSGQNSTITNDNTSISTGPVRPASVIKRRKIKWRTISGIARSPGWLFYRSGINYYILDPQFRLFTPQRLFTEWTCIFFIRLSSLNKFITKLFMQITFQFLIFKNYFTTWPSICPNWIYLCYWDPTKEFLSWTRTNIATSTSLFLGKLLSNLSLCRDYLSVLIFDLCHIKPLLFKLSSFLVIIFVSQETRQRRRKSQSIGVFY